MRDAETPSLKPTARRGRYFIRFGEIPEDALSKMWTAPNAFMYSRVGEALPGLSAYEVKKKGRKWVLNTDDINVGSGLASLSELFFRAVSSPDSTKIYLLRGVATSWKNMTSEERKKFDAWYPGKGCERYDILGTDGEPLVREFEVISTVSVNDLICEMISFPEDWQDELAEMAAAVAEQTASDLDHTAPGLCR